MRVKDMAAFERVFERVEDWGHYRERHATDADIMADSRGYRHTCEWAVELLTELTELVES